TTIAAQIVEISGHNVAHGKATAGSPWPSRSLLCLGEAQDAGAVCVLIVVSEDDFALRGAQVLDRIATLAAVAPRNPCTGAAGELAVAKVQSGLDEPEIRLVSHG